MKTRSTPSFGSPGDPFTLRVAAAVWSALALADAAQTYSRGNGRETVGTALLSAIPWWGTWLLLTPIVAFLAQRFPFDAKRRRRAVGVHVVAAVCVSCAHLAITGPAFWLTTGRFRGVPSWEIQTQRMFGLVLTDVLTYLGLVGSLLAARYARAYRDEELTNARLAARSALLEAVAANARLDALRMELNPHFFFNTLNALSGLVGRGDSDRAMDVIARLGALLRRTLDVECRHFTTVADEISILEHYLFIERARFGDRLDVQWCIDDDARDCRLPSLILQPLVENAVRHGIEPSMSRGVVRISVVREADALRVAVEDSGPGIPLTAGMPTRHGIGLRNTRDRLTVLYGPTAQLTFANPGGARVEMYLPAKTIVGDN